MKALARYRQLRIELTEIQTFLELSLSAMECLTFCEHWRPRACAQGKKVLRLEHIRYTVWVYWELNWNFRFKTLHFLVTQPDMGDAAA